MYALYEIPLNRVRIMRIFVFVYVIMNFVTIHFFVIFCT